jgi:hypothetical protein
MDSSVTCVECWTVFDVSCWLRAAGLFDAADLFRAHRIDGAVLLAMTEHDLTAKPLEMKRFGDVKKVARMIASLKANSVDFDAGDGVALTRQYSGGIEYVEDELDDLTPLGSTDHKESNLQRERKRSLTGPQANNKHQQVLVNNKFAVKRSRSSPAAKPASFGAVLNKKRKPFSFSDGRGDRADSYNDSYSHGISGHSSFPAPDSRGPFVTTSGIADEPNFRKTFFALVFMASSLIATALFGIIAEMRVPNPKKFPPLPDIVLDHLPIFPWGLKAAELCIGVLVASAAFITSQHKYGLIILRRFWVIMGAGYFLRAFTMIITSLAIPGKHLYDHCWRPDRNGTITKEMVVLGMKNTMLKLGMALRGVQTCGDYIYSGHAFTSSVLLMFINEYCLEEYFFLRPLSWVASALAVFFVLAGHEHYSVDVAIAFFLASRMFSYYHVLANGYVSRLRRSTRVAAWFPLLTYFESGIDGVLPNVKDNGRHPTSLGGALTYLFLGPHP